MLIIISVIVAFFATLLMTPYIIRYFRFVGITTADVHKKNKPLIPHSIGVPVTVGIMGGLFTYIFLKVFFFNDASNLVVLFAAISSIMLVMFSGFVDDINTKQMRVEGYVEGKKGLKTWQKPLLTLPAAIPLMALMIGNTAMDIPFLGSVDFGILYPLLIVPIAIVGASNMVNMLGGFNGLETGMGLVYTFSLGLFAYLHNETIASIIFFTTSASLLAILKYNFFPAKILAGDSITYLLGSVVAVGAILGNMEKATLVVMLPFIIQGTLKFYSKFRLGHFASDLGILQKDGKIKSKYETVYSWTHVAMKLNLTEKQIVLFMILIQIVFASLPFLLFKM
jgi:UDP-N-acetylglucosamine--dolichyl-phosphate N-acetylglucosaminephosphotransferase